MGRRREMPNRAACEKLAKELSACFISAVESMDEHWDSMGMSEKEKLRSIKRVAKVRIRGHDREGGGGGWEVSHTNP